MNVLITSASRKVALVRAFREALAEEGGGSVVAADASAKAPALYLADRGALVPRTDDPGFVEAIVDLCRREEIDLIVPTRDEELPLFAETREAFEGAGARVLVPGREPVEICRDKRRFVEHCRAHGFETPRTYASSDRGGIERWPVFVKPRIGKGGRGAGLVGSADELERALVRLPDAVVQEAIEAPEFTIDTFLDFEGRPVSAVPRERLYVFGGESFVSRTVEGSRLSEAAIGLSRSIGLTGHLTVQAFDDGGTVRFIEINPRYGGASHLGFAAGAPTPRFVVRLLLGRPVEPRVGRHRRGLTMLRYTEDLFLGEGELLGGGR